MSEALGMGCEIVLSLSYDIIGIQNCYLIHCLIYLSGCNMTSGKQAPCTTVFSAPYSDYQVYF